MSLMNTYQNLLTDDERAMIESALDGLNLKFKAEHGINLDGSDEAARAAEALAVYIFRSLRPRAQAARVSDASTPSPYAARVADLMREGMTRSDAQAVADAEGLDDA